MTEGFADHRLISEAGLWFYVVVSRRGRSFFEKVVTPVVSVFARAGFTPNMLTFLGLVATAASLFFYMLAKANSIYFLFAALLLAVGSLLDGLDGPLARHTGRQSNAGAFLDSFIDRVSDTLIVVGFMLTGFVDGFLAVAMLASSMLVSYARARGESLNVSLREVGFGERAVRLLAAIAGTLLAIMHPLALQASAIFIIVVSTVTAVQRVWATMSILSGRT